jgi:hypothetical protein
MDTFDEQFVKKLYSEKVDLPQSYFEKYENLSDCFKIIKIPSHYDFPRVRCILDFKEWVEKYKIKPSFMGVTCLTDPELQFIKAEKILNFPYPPFDLHTIGTVLSDGIEPLDFFIFNQTIEHLYNPFLAIKNVNKIMKQDGYVFTSVPVMNIPHMMPFHYNGYTPIGLAMLFVVNGFEVVEIGQWGNLDYIKQQWQDIKWPTYQDLSHDGIIKNEKDRACQCWILAKKIKDV